MKMKKWLFAAAAVAVAIALAGCPTNAGGNNNEEDDNGDLTLITVFNLATDPVFQALPLGPIADNAAAEAAWSGTPLQVVGTVGAPPGTVTYTIVEHEGRRALQVAITTDWSGVDVTNSFSQFRAGDVITVEVLPTVVASGAQILLNLDHAGWAPLGGWNPAMVANEPIGNEFTLTQANVNAIGSANPTNIRIRTNQVPTTFILTELRIFGYRAGVPGQTFEVSLDVEDDPHVFAALDVSGDGYTADDITPLTVTVTNTGNQPTGALTAELSGTNYGSFVLTGYAIASLDPEAYTSFTVAPRLGLATGTHVATVSVVGANDIRAYFGVSVLVYDGALPQLVMGEISVNAAGVVSWPAATGGEVYGYRVILNGTPHTPDLPATARNIDLATLDLDFGTHTVRVIALGVAEESRDSEPSNEVEWELVGVTVPLSDFIILEGFTSEVLAGVYITEGTFTPLGPMVNAGNPTLRWVGVDGEALALEVTGRTGSYHGLDIRVTGADSLGMDPTANEYTVTVQGRMIGTEFSGNAHITHHPADTSIANTPFALGEPFTLTGTLDVAATHIRLQSGGHGPAGYITSFAIDSVTIERVVFVPPDPETVSVAPVSVTFIVGVAGNQQFTATVGPPGAQPSAVEWRIDGAARTGVSINADGLLTVTAAAEVTGDNPIIVRATVTGFPTVTNTATVTIVDEADPRIELDPLTLTITAGETDEVGIEVFNINDPVAGTTVYFTSANVVLAPANAYVTINGNIAINDDGEGTGTIELEVEAGAPTSGPHTVTVTIGGGAPPATFTLNVEAAACACNGWMIGCDCGTCDCLDYEEELTGHNFLANFVRSGAARTFMLADGSLFVTGRTADWHAIDISGLAFLPTVDYEVVVRGYTVAGETAELSWTRSPWSVHPGYELVTDEGNGIGSFTLTLNEPGSVLADQGIRIRTDGEAPFMVTSVTVVALGDCEEIRSVLMNFNTEAPAIECDCPDEVLLPGVVWELAHLGLSVGDTFSGWQSPIGTGSPLNTENAVVNVTTAGLYVYSRGTYAWNGINITASGLRLVGVSDTDNTYEIRVYGLIGSTGEIALFEGESIIARAPAEGPTFELAFEFDGSDAANMRIRGQALPQDATFTITDIVVERLGN